MVSTRPALRFAPSRSRERSIFDSSLLLASRLRPAPVLRDFASSLGFRVCEVLMFVHGCRWFGKLPDKLHILVMFATTPPAAPAPPLSRWVEQTTGNLCSKASGVSGWIPSAARPRHEKATSERGISEPKARGRSKSCSPKPRLSSTTLPCRWGCCALKFGKRVGKTCPSPYIIS